MTNDPTRTKPARESAWKQWELGGRRMHLRAWPVFNQPVSVFAAAPGKAARE